MVAYSALGWSNIKISEELGYTTVHVSNVLNLPQSKELRDKIMLRMRERTMEDIPTMLAHIAQKTTERLKLLVDDDEQFKKSPFMIIDRGLDVIKGLGHLKGGGNGSPQVPVNQQNNFFNIPSQFLDRLNLGMAASDKALEVHAPAPDKQLTE